MIFSKVASILLNGFRSTLPSLTSRLASIRVDSLAVITWDLAGLELFRSHEGNIRQWYGRESNFTISASCDTTIAVLSWPLARCLAIGQITERMMLLRGIVTDPIMEEHIETSMTDHDTTLRKISPCAKMLPSDWCEWGCMEKAISTPRCQGLAKMSAYPTVPAKSHQLQGLNDVAQDVAGGFTSYWECLVAWQWQCTNCRFVSGWLCQSWRKSTGQPQGSLCCRSFSAVKNQMLSKYKSRHRLQRSLKDQRQRAK